MSESVTRARIQVPKPPAHHPQALSVVRDSDRVCFIWLLREGARATIETQYKNAAQIRALKDCGKSTAYRIINRHKKRYWLTDLTDEEHPMVYSVLPADVVEKAEIKPVGNPNFASGIYQQHIARKRRRYAIDNITNWD